jgi:hypothetical protein
MLFMQGAAPARNITVIYCAQRPAGLPGMCLSEANRVACFQLSNPMDRKKVAGYTDPALLTMVTDHDFWWFEKGPDPNPVRTRLKGREQK